MFRLFMSATGKTFSNHSFNDGTDGSDNANPQSEITTEVAENEDLQQHLVNNLPQNMMSSLTESELNDSFFGYDSTAFESEQPIGGDSNASSPGTNVPSILLNHPMLNKVTGQNDQQTGQAHNPNSAPNVVVNTNFIKNKNATAKHFGANTKKTQQPSPKSRPLPVPPVKNRADINVSDKKLVTLETNTGFSNAHFTLATKGSLSLQNISVGHNNVQNIIIPRSFISTKFDLAATYNVKISKSNAWANNFKSETFYKILLNDSVVASAFVCKTDEHSITLQVQCSKQIKNSILKKLNAAEQITEITTPDNNNTNIDVNTTINKSETPQDKKAEDDKKGFFAYIKANPAKSTAIFLSGVAAIGLMGCAYHNREAISANFKMAINSEILRGFINTIQDFAFGLYDSVNLGFSRS